MRLGNRDRSNVEDRRGLGGTGLRLGLGGTLVLVALSLIFKQDFLSMVGGGAEAPVCARAGRAAQGRRGGARGGGGRVVQRRAGRLGTPARRPLPRVEARAVLGRDAVRVRRRVVRDGAVLLPARREGLHRPRLLPRAGAPLRRRPASSRRRTSSPTRSGTTSSTSSGSRRACGRRRSAIPRRRTRSPSGWSSRRTAWPAPGRTSVGGRGRLDPGDVEEGLGAAAAVGRRPHPAQDHGERPARELHPRYRGAARTLVPARLRRRRASTRATRSARARSSGMSSRGGPDTLVQLGHGSGRVTLGAGRSGRARAGALLRRP